MMEDGVHPAKVMWAKARSSKTGKTQFVLKWENDKGAIAWQNITVSPESQRAMAVFYLQMAVLGFTEVMLNDKDITPDAIAEGLVGQEAHVTVETELWQGKPQTKVRWLS